MVTDFSVRFNMTPCLHRRVVPVIKGGMHFSEGEVWDDIHEYLLCLDCLEYMTEAEIRARWTGNEASVRSAVSQEEDDDVPF
jgi:hypothetical protein